MHAGTINRLVRRRPTVNKAHWESVTYLLRALGECEPSLQHVRMPATESTPVTAESPITSTVNTFLLLNPKM